MCPFHRLDTRCRSSVSLRLCARCCSERTLKKTDHRGCSMARIPFWEAGNHRGRTDDCNKFARAGAQRRVALALGGTLHVWVFSLRGVWCSCDSGWSLARGKEGGRRGDPPLQQRSASLVPLAEELGERARLKRASPFTPVCFGVCLCSDAGFLLLPRQETETSHQHPPELQGTWSKVSEESCQQRGCLAGRRGA